MPIPQFSLVEAILTQSTCGEACWHAIEDVCRCSCGGKNHGCLRSEHGERPARTSKIDGEFYTLKAVGLNGELYDSAKQINEANGPYKVVEVSETLTYRYFYHETDKHAPARIKPATKDQIAKWPELAAYRNVEPWNRVVLLWVKGVIE